MFTARYELSIIQFNSGLKRAKSHALYFHMQRSVSKDVFVHPDSFLLLYTVWRFADRASQYIYISI